MLYLADTAHFPYSSLSAAALRRRAELLVEFLLERRCKLIVVACNTATVHTLAHLRATFPNVPFVGVVPVVKLLVERTSTGIIAMLSTPATAESAYLADLIERFAAGCKVVNVACPGLADLIESAPADDPAIAAHLDAVLAPVKAGGADVLGLGCTHYPLILPQIRRALGPDIRIFDSARPVARRIREVLAERDALASAGGGGALLFSTRHADRLAEAAQRVLPQLSPTARAVRLESRDDLREIPQKAGSSTRVGTKGDPGAQPCCYTTDRADTRAGAGHEAGTGYNNTERCAR